MIFIEQRLTAVEQRIARLEQALAVCSPGAGSPQEIYALCEQVVSSQLGVTVAAIRGRNRPQHIAWARQLVHYMAVEFIPIAHLQIAHLADRDHATIEHSCRAVANRCATEFHASNEVDTIRQRLRELIP